MHLLIALAIASSPIRIEVANTAIQIQNPNPTVWREVDRRSDPERGKGMVMLKRETLKGSDGVAIQPVLSVVFERLPKGIDSVREYAKFARQRTPFQVLRIDESNNSVIYRCRYNNGMEHRVTIAHYLFKDIALQLIADTTESVLPQVESDIEQFISNPPAAVENET